MSKRVEAPRPQEQEEAPEPPRSWVEGDPITISDGSDGDRLLKDAHSMDEEVEASPVAKRTPWPIELHSVEEKRKKKEKECERETQQQLQEGQQQPCNSRSRKVKKKKKGGGNKGTSLRSCWSRIGSRSYGSSRGSSGRRVSS